MTRQEYLENELQELTDKCVADASGLKSLTRNVDKRYTSGSRDRIVAVATRLHDNNVALATVKKDLKNLIEVQSLSRKLLARA